MNEEHFHDAVFVVSLLLFAALFVFYGLAISQAYFPELP